MLINGDADADSPIRTIDILEDGSMSRTAEAIATIISGAFATGDSCGAFSVARADAGNDFVVCGIGANATAAAVEEDALAIACALPPSS